MSLAHESSTCAQPVLRYTCVPQSARHWYNHQSPGFPSSCNRQSLQHVACCIVAVPVIFCYHVMIKYHDSNDSPQLAPACSDVFECVEGTCDPASSTDASGCVPGAEIQGACNLSPGTQCGTSTCNTATGDCVEDGSTGNQCSSLGASCACNNFICEGAKAQTCTATVLWNMGRKRAVTCIPSFKALVNHSRCVGTHHGQQRELFGSHLSDGLRAGFFKALLPDFPTGYP